MKHGLVAALLMLFFHGAPSAARLIGPPQIPEMVEQADLIVVGRVIATREIDPEIGNPDGGSFVQEFAISVDRVLKGALPKTVRLWALIPAGYAAGGGMLTGSYEMFFLKGSEHGEHVTSTFAPNSIVVAPGANIPATAAPLEAVALELVHSLASLRKAMAGTHEYPNMTRDELSDVYISIVVSSIPGIPVDIVHKPLLAVAHDADPMTRIRAIGLLFRFDDFSLLREAVPILMSNNPKLSALAGDAAGFLGGYRGTAITKDMIPYLAELLKAPNSIVRESAASVIRSISNEASIRPLALVALRDSDADVRKQAELGLCEITKTMIPPCRTQASEEEYRIYWNGWVQSNFSSMQTHK